jgi:hypothetical protein
VFGVHVRALLAPRALAIVRGLLAPGGTLHVFQHEMRPRDTSEARTAAEAQVSALAVGGFEVVR